MQNHPHTPHTPTTDVLILGSGISGLIAGSILMAHHRSVVLLEKARGPGGRLATRRTPLASDPNRTATFDHGIQFLEFAQAQKTLEIPDQSGNPSPWEILQPFLTQEQISSWTWTERAPHNLLSLRPLPAMNALPKTLPAAQHVQAQKKVIQLSYETNNTASGPGTWIALSEDGSSSYARNLVSTIPVPQLLALLNQSHLPQASLGQTMAIKKLQSLAYHPCISLMIILSKTPHSPDSVTRHPSPEIDCIVNNTNKGISPHTPCVTIFASASWSRAHFADSDEAVFKHLWSLCRSDTQAEPVEHQIHRWRYSTPETHCPESFLELPLIEDRHAPPLLIGGDAFGRDDLTPFERAILSGEAIARHLQKAK